MYKKYIKIGESKKFKKLSSPPFVFMFDNIILSQLFLSTLKNLPSKYFFNFFIQNIVKKISSPQGWGGQHLQADDS